MKPLSFNDMREMVNNMEVPEQMKKELLEKADHPIVSSLSDISLKNMG